MRSVFSWFITGMAVIFWIFRVVISIMETLEIDFYIKPIDMNIEIALLFITIPALILTFKRSLFGGIIYFVAYMWYFGMELAKILENIIINNVLFSMEIATQGFICLIAITISLLNLIDIALSKYRKSENPSKKVDWFYKNKNYDRNLDERIDKNNYRIY